MLPVGSGSPALVEYRWILVIGSSIYLIFIFNGQNIGFMYGVNMTCIFVYNAFTSKFSGNRR